jgi:hypothetical protein
MEYRTLELNIISAKDLKNVKLFSKMDVYNVISISGDPLNPQTAATHINHNGGTSPTWNSHFKFTINDSLANQNRLSLEVNLISDRTLSRDTLIGKVHIPLKELLDNPSGDSFRLVNYQVRTSSGKAKGNLNLSYKFGEKVQAYPPPGMAAAGSSSVPYGTPYPPQPQQPGYGYPEAQVQKPKPKRNSMEMGFGVWLPWMLIGDMMYDACSYDARYGIFST